MNQTPETGGRATRLALEIIKLAEEIELEDVHRAFQAVLILRGHSGKLGGATMLSTSANGLQQSIGEGDWADLKLGPRALKWIQRNDITKAQLDEVFHLNGDRVEIIASEVPGAGKKEMTINCYLLSGVRGLLQSDEPKINESETVELAKRLTAYDKNNHTTFRKSVGSRVTGSKPEFTLTGPGERAAAELIKLMTAP